MSSKRVLVLDEESLRRRVNVFGLRCAGFAVDEAEDGASARSQIARHYPHLIVIIAALLDFGIQDFMRSLRSESTTRDIPVVALVERESEFDAKAAREWGLDDYMLEPISPEEFVSRLRATVDGRVRQLPIHGELANIRVDNDCGMLRKGDCTVAVGPTERRLFEFLLAHSEQLIPRELLLFRIWGVAASLQSRVVDVSVCRLRRALEQLGCAEMLQTVSRRGYRLSARVSTGGERAPEDNSCHEVVTGSNFNARRA